MKLPHIVHPKKFTHNGARFVVVTYEPVSDQQAFQIVIFYLRANQRKFREKKTYYLLYNNANGTFF